MSRARPSPSGDAAARPLLALLELGHRARAAETANELAFLLVNDTRILLPCRQAALWFADGGVHTLSGVIEPEGHAPFVQWLNRLCRVLASSADAGDDAAHAVPRRIDRAALPEEVAAPWAEWLPQHAVWLPIAASAEHAGSTPGGLLVAADDPVSDDTLAVLQEWLHVWRHAWLARLRTAPWRHALFGGRYAGDEGARRKPWWRHRPIQLVFLMLCVLLVPVRLTVLAPGELVPANPAVIRAPLDGVIGQFHVRPNEPVKAQQLLFTFDEAPIASRLELARQSLATAEAEYRQSAQLALNDSRSKAQLAALIGTVREKRAEAEYLQAQLDRSRVLAPRDGVAVFDDPSEWIGRPVQTGERVMRLATPDEMEIEGWLAIGDAIPVAEKAEVRLYLAATPFDPVAGQLRYIAHDAVPRPDGSYAYRVRATLDRHAAQRIGMKGTAKLYGRWVPMGYYVVRRPLATVRQFLAI